MKEFIKIAAFSISGFMAVFVGYVAYSAFTGYLGDTSYIEEISNPNSKTNQKQIGNYTENASSTSTTTQDIKLSETKNTKENNNTKNMTATISTSMGIIEMELFASKSPNTVKNFSNLANSGFYNGVKFHRVIDGFMIQTGDPLSKDDSKKDYWGTGGPGYKFNDELVGDETYVEGTVAMANSGPNTNGSQFFIMTSNTPLPPSYTVFGRVTKGQDVANKIQKVDRDGRDRPLVNITISKISISN